MIPRNQHRLIFAGERLQDGTTLSDCGIMHFSRLLESAPVELQVHIPCEDMTFTLIVAARDSIDLVKAKIHFSTGIPSNQQRLKFDGRLLSNGRLLCDVLPNLYGSHYTLTLD